MAGQAARLAKQRGRLVRRLLTQMRGRRKSWHMAPNLEDELRSSELRAVAQVHRTLQLSAELEAAEVTATSLNGEVTVRVHSASGLADLQSRPSPTRVSRDESAHLVLVTACRAQARLAERVDESTAGNGTGTGTAALVSEVYASRYPQLDDDTETR